MFFNFWVFLIKMYIFEVVIFFSCLVAIQSTLNYQNAYGYEAFQSDDVLRGALTHKYVWRFNGKVLWSHVTNKIHIFTCRRCMVRCWLSVRGSQTRPSDKMINVRSRDRFKNFVRVAANKLLTLGRMFSTQRFRCHRLLVMTSVLFWQNQISVRNKMI